MEIKLNIKKPIMPSEIFMEQPIGKRQDGFNPSKGNIFNPSKGSIKVKDLTEEQAYEYAELMKQTFIEHWKSGGKNER
jgi:hypothetical protein